MRQPSSKAPKWETGLARRILVPDADSGIAAVGIRTGNRQRIGSGLTEAEGATGLTDYTVDHEGAVAGVELAAAAIHHQRQIDRLGVVAQISDTAENLHCIAIQNKRSGRIGEGDAAEAGIGRDVVRVV